MSDEVHHSGLLSTLSWIFNWRVPKVSHPQPWDVALNNYSAYAVSGKQQRRRQHQLQRTSQKWSRRKRKHRNRQRTSGFQHRISSGEVSTSQAFQNPHKGHHPYEFEKPLHYYDASQVYFYPAAAASQN